MAALPPKQLSPIYLFVWGFFCPGTEISACEPEVHQRQKEISELVP